MFIMLRKEECTLMFSASCTNNTKHPLNQQQSKKMKPLTTVNCQLLIIFCHLLLLTYSYADIVQITPKNPLQDTINWNNQDEIWFAQSCPLTGANSR